MSQELMSDFPYAERDKIQRHNFLKGCFCKTFIQLAATPAFRDQVGPCSLKTPSFSCLASCKGMPSCSCSLGTCAGCAFALPCPAILMLSAQDSLLLAALASCAMPTRLVYIQAGFEPVLK